MLGNIVSYCLLSFIQATIVGIYAGCLKQKWYICGLHPGYFGNTPVWKAFLPFWKVASDIHIEAAMLKCDSFVHFGKNSIIQTDLGTPAKFFQCKIHTVVTQSFCTIVTGKRTEESKTNFVWYRPQLNRLSLILSDIWNGQSFQNYLCAVKKRRQILTHCW